VAALATFDQPLQEEFESVLFRGFAYAVLPVALQGFDDQVILGLRNHGTTGQFLSDPVGLRSRFGRGLHLLRALNLAPFLGFDLDSFGFIVVPNSGVIDRVAEDLTDRGRIPARFPSRGFDPSRHHLPRDRALTETFQRQMAHQLVALDVLGDSAMNVRRFGPRGRLALGDRLGHQFLRRHEMPTVRRLAPVRLSVADFLLHTPARVGEDRTALPLGLHEPHLQAHPLLMVLLVRSEYAQVAQDHREPVLVKHPNQSQADFHFSREAIDKGERDRVDVTLAVIFQSVTNAGAIKGRPAVASVIDAELLGDVAIKCLLHPVETEILSFERVILDLSRERNAANPCGD
jgi:hypothetical protein